MWHVMMVFVMLIGASGAQAAYKNPTVISNERHPNGSTQLVFQFQGSAGEPVVTRSYTVTAQSTVTGLRNWVNSVVEELDLMHAAASLGALQPGQVVPRLTPVDTAPTAKQTWTRKAHTCAQFKGIFAAGALTTAVNAVCGDAEATYQAGFLD